jgi:hypothetical protein
MTINPTSVKKLHDRAVYLVVSWSFLGTWKKAETKDTSSEVRASKRIIASDSVKKLRALRSRIRSLLRQYTLNSLFRPGVYCIPLEYIPQLEERLKEAADELEAIRAELKSEWPAIIKDAKKRLGKLFDEADYSDPDEAVSELTFSYRYIPIADTPMILKEVAVDIYKQDLERSREQSEQELEAFRANLRVALLRIIENMRKTLTKPDGKRRVFGKRFFKNLNEFMETFDGRNFSDDGEMESVVKQLRTVAAGHVDADALKSSETMQVKLDKSLSKIDKSLKTMVAKEDSRMINLALASE